MADREPKEINFLEKKETFVARVSIEDIQATRRVLQAIKQDPGYPKGYDQAIKHTLDTQEQFARLREFELELKRTRVLIVRRNVKAKLKVLAAIIAGAYLGTTIGFGINDYTSPEASAAREEASRVSQQQRKEADKNAAIDFEKNHTLGLKPSTVSATGWRIFREPNYPNLKYTEQNGLQSPFVIEAGRGLNWKVNDNTSTITNIRFNTFKDSEGNIVPKISIFLTERDSDKPEEWVLSDKLPDINNQIVTFEYTKTGQRFYLSISKTKTDSKLWQVKLMEKDPSD